MFCTIQYILSLGRAHRDHSPTPSQTSQGNRVLYNILYHAHNAIHNNWIQYLMPHCTVCYGTIPEVGRRFRVYNKTDTSRAVSRSGIYFFAYRSPPQSILHLHESTSSKIGAPTCVISEPNHPRLNDARKEGKIILTIEGSSK